MKRKHAELIKAWADGAVIQYKQFCGDWEDVLRNPRWVEDTEYRIKPERVYPKSSLSYGELCDFHTAAWEKTKTVNAGEGVVTIALRICADAAVKRYIQENESK